MNQSQKLYKIPLLCMAGLLTALSAMAQTGTQNYVRTRVPRVAVPTNVRLDVLTPIKDSVETTIQYVDGLGRPLQTVMQQASPGGKDMIQAFGYDSYGREVQKYLPYVNTSTSYGTYRADALTAGAGVRAFYNPSGATVDGKQTSGIVLTPVPFEQTGLEASPLGRVLEQGAPGVSWQIPGTAGAGNAGSSNHTLRSVMTLNDQSGFSGADTTGSNGGSRKAALYTAQINADASGTRSLLRTGNTATYNTNQLIVTINRDENWKPGDGCFGTVEEYKDKEGHVVLKRTYNIKQTVSGGTVTRAAEMLSTYYVYDDLGNLCFVLPPGASPDALAAISQATIDTRCYQYRYDERGRLTQKKIPGKGWEYMIYNKLDQVIATQDSVQMMKSTGEWTVTKYDNMGRPVITGIFQYGAAGTHNRGALQAAADAVSTYWETPVASGNGYTNNTWPATLATTLSVSYYDVYIGIPGLPATYDKHTSANYTPQTTGMATASKTLVLNTSADYLWTVPYYDKEGKVVRSFSQHYLGGTSLLSEYNFDDVQTGYSFTKQPVTVVRYHYTSNAGKTAAGLALTSTDNYTYDHVGRKRNSLSRLKDGANAAQAQVIVSASSYNEIGQLSKKGVHCINGANFLQNLNYRYNARGWLTNINNPTLTADGGLTNTDTNDQFGMELKYDSTSVSRPQYNGNIARAIVKAGNVSGTSYGALSYDYRYDKLNRLNDAVSSGAAGKDGYQSEYVRYDPMGNIQTLGRYDKIGTARTQIDTLAYTYIGNRVDRIDDASAYAGTYGFTNGASQAGEYTYDGNGNQLKDLNNGLSSISYNMLNLPQAVTKTNGNTAVYVYDAAGRKLRKLFTAGSTTTVDEYVDGIQYEYTGSTPTIAFIQTEEGRARKSGTVYKYEYDLKDNLGNTRLTTTWEGSDPTQMTPLNLQRQDYYAFGYAVQSSQYVVNPKNDYLYNGKELQEETGLYDYGARLYDPVVGRWTSVDPLSEISRRWSPYRYGFDNPIRFVDPDGMTEADDMLNDRSFEKKSDIHAGITAALASPEKSDVNISTNEKEVSGNESSDGPGSGAAKADATSTSSKVPTIAPSVTMAQLGQRIATNEPATVNKWDGPHMYLFRHLYNLNNNQVGLDKYVGKFTYNVYDMFIVYGTHVFGIGGDGLHADGSYANMNEVRTSGVGVATFYIPTTRAIELMGANRVLNAAEYSKMYKGESWAGRPGAVKYYNSLIRSLASFSVKFMWIVRGTNTYGFGVPAVTDGLKKGKK